MTQTEQVSIGGYAFILEKAAAESLGRYLKELEAHYLPQEGGKEIMEGIEERVAELLLDKCGSGTVVTESHVQSVIQIVGRPERIEADDPATGEPEGAKPQRKLYRDQSNKRLGGVCSGLAAYFGIDVAWLRMGLAVLSLVLFFSGKYTGVWSLAVPVFYCLLWVAMPAARTAQDRWAMKGDSGTADEIRRNVQAGIHEMGDAAREVAHSDFFKRFGRVLILLVGILLLITGTSGLASVSILGLKGTELFGVPYAHFLDKLQDFSPAFMDMLGTPWIVALAAFAVILPFVGILYGGIQMIFGFKSPSWKPGLVIFVLWLIDLVVLAVLGFAGFLSADTFWI